MDDSEAGRGTSGIGGKRESREIFARPPLPAMKTFTLQPVEAVHPLALMLAGIEGDLAGKTTILEMFKGYFEDLKKSPESNEATYTKMAALFQLGLTPDVVEGHCYGLTLGLRMSGPKLALPQMDNIVSLIWGATLEDACPWVGKTFRRLDEGAFQSLTGAALEGSAPAFRGINHFNLLASHPASGVAFHGLTAWLNLDRAPAEEQTTYGNDNNGGHFLAYRARSICAETPREVFSLNYRWGSMNNRAPLTWLVDELVQIADGLYLGQLLFATKHLMGAYDPARPVAEDHYQQTGYFLLWDERWNEEARRLFPSLGIPANAPGLVAQGPLVVPTGSRFTRLSLETPTPSICDDRIFAEVQEDLRAQPSVMHLLKYYSDKLWEEMQNDSPYYLRLRELFKRGTPLREMNGFYRGASVSWRSEGLLKRIEGNAVGEAWQRFGGRLSPWTGKRFETGPERLAQIAEITDGYETGAVPTYLGANTIATRTMQKRDIVRMMDLANIRTDTVPGEEALRYGYDRKTLYFIAREAESVAPDCRGKRVLQVNYRWPKLHSFVPYPLSIDELVQIADGLYLGQDMFATNVTRPWDPYADPAEYKYETFCYFLIMDEEWHQIRLRIGFDLDEA